MKPIQWWSLLPGTALALLALLTITYGNRLKSYAADLLQNYTSPFAEAVYHSDRFRLSKPAVHPAQTDQKYPLVVYLHGAGSRGSDNKKQIKGLKYLGNGINPQARSFRETYPCFVYVPQCPEGAVWEGEQLTRIIATIEHLIATQPIDPKRLYLIGYSMGGSGVYALAEKYYDTSGRPVAAIVRLAGQSTFQPRVHEIVAKSAVWLHVGLQDIPLRVEKAREAYAFIKRYHGNPQERTQEFRLNGQQAKTTCMIIENRKKVVLTEYLELGHGIPHMPFENQQITKWLFDQKN